MGSSVLTPFAEPGVFRAGAAGPAGAPGLAGGPGPEPTPAADLAADRAADLDLDEIEAFYRQHGFVILRDLLGEKLIARMEQECEAAQAGVLAGDLSARYGSTQYLDDAAKAERFVNYVEHIQELAPAVGEAAEDPVLTGVIRRLIGARIWLSGSEQTGVVYQDARPGRESGYTRIGWHSDWQAMPSLDVWPGLAITIHIDATSPANGFLRVVPGSHQWATPAPYRNVNGVPVPADARPTGGYTDTAPPFEMPLGFEKVLGEIAVYAERGDVLLHDGYLWHSAARATDDDTRRRHVRGSFFAGEQAAYRRQFIKNAAR
ncbi:phytanoyl-CoA dioxygenase family protein [Parafrankia sp. EUN1f]|uniref:phytanoyl-CoA dioxygenase family protein n=1 Tax=Parafrankia sp. EUN1f TaxID=102897 RepID=UPI0001C44B2C|nr:phytanoyl-CoA dioxygenase family protein [Parafrankia sp. EUN1f]EFC82428.1 Phytanoyl-CoA dioxygenase [Parafrankia sp. EUN1f]